MTQKGTRHLDIFSADGKSLLHSFPFDEIPTGLLPDGDKVYVTTFEKTGRLQVLSLESGRVEAAIQGCRAFSPYIMTLMMSSLFGSLASLFWMRSTTADLNTTLGWAIITFILITYNKIKFGGIKGYLKGFLEPIFVMAPLNVLSEIATPVSMSFRHFGNMAGGLVITTLIMGALKVLSNAVLGFLPVPLLQIGLPGVLSLYFDCFTACMQAFIFSMLTMAYVGDARGS